MSFAQYGETCEHCEKVLPLICAPFCDECYFGIKHEPHCDCLNPEEADDSRREYAEDRPATKTEFFWGF